MPTPTRPTPLADRSKPSCSQPSCSHLGGSCAGTCSGYESTTSCPPLIVLAVLAAFTPLVAFSPTALALVRSAGATR